MKRFYLVLFLLCLFFVSCGETEVSFEFEVKNREVTITKMKGRSKSITVPSTINGMPVVEFYSNYYLFQDKGIEKITLPNTLTSLGSLSDNKLTTLTIPNSVKVISQGALRNNKLTSITIPEGCEIRTGAFEDNQLTSVNLPNSLREIEMFVFKNNKLTSITIPSRVKKIQGGAFKKIRLPVLQYLIMCI